jgi:DHA2 family multidrug resistance protein
VVKEGQHVNAGDVLFEIDPVPFRLAVDQAKATLEQAHTTYDNLVANIKIYGQMLDLAQQGVDLKQRDVDRKTTLVKSNFGSQLDLDNAANALVTAGAQAQFIKQQVSSAKTQLLGKPDLPLEQFPPYVQAKAALEQAERNLDHTVMRAPMPGIATQVDQIQLGRFVMAGGPVFSVIDIDNPWVDANPKESDFTYVAVGQPVTLDVDAFPNHVFKGTVGSLSPGTGAQFAILPPQNATGNFVKVVQRVPVRIYFDRDDKFVQRLKAGMSVYATIDTGHKRSLAGLLGLSPAAAKRGLRAMSPTQLPSPSAVPGLRRNMVTICAMTATVMQALDTTIANVALPYMQGTLSASQDQINWVLTSYIVAAAIMTAPVGWIANRFGRKRIFIVCSAGFTIASVMCGLAQDINQMVLFRLLQGVFGAALVPLSQAVMLDSYTLQERAKAMSIWGMGVMMGPIMGPSLGAWLTETYSWHWVFFVNLPFGIITVLGLVIFMDETKKNLDLRFDWFGFAALAIGIGSLQVALDRGEQLGWLESNEIIGEFIVSAVGFYYFFAHSLTTEKPFIQFAIFKDKNFIGGCVFMAVMGLVLFSTMALSSPYLQNVIGYPIITAGLLLASRGCGTFVAMMLVGRMMRFIEARTLIISGLSLTCLSLFYMTGWTDQTGVPEIVTLSIMQGFGFGLVFVPLSTVAFLTLPNHLRTDGTSMLTLLRNVASSIGISIVIAQLTEGSRRVYAVLSQHVTPFNHAMQMPDVRGMIDMSTDAGRAMADVMVQLQAQIIAFSLDYQLVMLFTLCTIPLAIIIGSSKAALRKQAAAPEHAVME